MNASDSHPTGRAVPQAGSLPWPWPWHVWVAIGVAFAVTFTANFALKPSLAITPPALSFFGDNCTVTFRATNNTDERASASLLVIVGIGTPGGDSTSPTYTEFARKTVSVTLAPKQAANLSCEFPVAGRSRPNTARVEIASYNKTIK